MKKELKGLSDPTKFHEPLRLQGIDQKILINMIKSMIIIRKLNKN